MSLKRKYIKFIILSELMEDDEELLINKRKRIWAQNWLLRRSDFSHTNLLAELKLTGPKELKNFLRMNKPTYELLLEKVRPLIEKQNTVMRQAITVHERLSITLRFLATGRSFADLRFSSAISPQSIGKIIEDTCFALIKVLKEYIHLPNTEDEWRAVAKDFDIKWNYPHCLGAIDGKHVEIVKPHNTGSYYFNYKKSFSIVLLAIVNANYEFLNVEVGANGRVSDGGVYKNSAFFEKFSSNAINIPPPEELPDHAVTLPYVLVADDAFPLGQNLMKPYSHASLTNRQRIFNYRLSRARRIVENGFGILAQRFRVLLTTIKLEPKKVSVIVLACCHLHNFLIAKNRQAYLQGSVDTENITTRSIQGGDWRENCRQLMDLEASSARHPAQTAKHIRDEFANYFHDIGAVNWQDQFSNTNN